jgi:hypothetical protein
MSDQAPDSTAPTHRLARSQHTAFHFCLLITIAAAARIAWMCALPPHVISVDLNDWHRVAEGLQLGMNPYARWRVLNWPPFWMEIIDLCMSLSSRFGWDFFSCIRTVLIVGDLGVLAATFFLLRMLAPQSNHGLLFLLGYCLNPLLVLLTIQHGNFDAIAELWIVLMLICLIRFRRGRQEIDFLLAAACLGMGGFTKTFPLMLWPLLAWGARTVSARTRWLAAGLIVGPITLALAPLYVLSPAEVSSHVIHYRGFSECFGILGLLNVLHAEPDHAAYSTIFTCLFLAGLAVLALRLWRRDITSDSDVVLLATIILLSSFALGPGYAPQYWFWVTPLLLVVYQQYKKARVVLLPASIVIVATNVFEYAIVPSLGEFWTGWGRSSERLKQYGERILFSDPDLAKLHLPMTLASLAVLAVAIAMLGRGKQRAES